jgi:hypothetical protein
MGLLTCALCGCTITAERKKHKYTYYRCTGFQGPCGNPYVREDRLADLLGAAVEQIQIPSEIADWIAEGVRESQSDLGLTRQQSLAQLTQRRAVQAKLDRGYDDYLEGRISELFWRRKSEEWESELTTVAGELNRLADSTPSYAPTAERILELAKNACFLYSQQDFAERRRLLDTVLSNCTFVRGTLCPTYSKPFDLFVRGNETGDWRGRRDSRPLAETAGLGGVPENVGPADDRAKRGSWRRRRDSNPFHRVFANR